MEDQKPNTQIIKRIRQQKGLTLQQVANYIGVTRAAVSNWETGRQNVSKQNFAKLAAVLDVDESKLFGMIYGDNPQAPKSTGLDDYTNELRRILAVALFESYQTMSIRGLERLLTRLDDDISELKSDIQSS